VLPTVDVDAEKQKIKQQLELVKDGPQSQGGAIMKHFALKRLDWLRKQGYNVD